jgi:hypothetical protein
MTIINMKFRQLLKITSRTSTITNCFVQAIIPHLKPSETEIEEAIRVLGMDPAAPLCVYCDSPATDWDHLRPLVYGKRPSGYISEIRNLVPCCGPCNQSLVDSREITRSAESSLASGLLTAHRPTEPI